MDITERENQASSQSQKEVLNEDETRKRASRGNLGVQERDSDSTACQDISKLPKLGEIRTRGYKKEVDERCAKHFRIWDVVSSQELQPFSVFTCIDFASRGGQIEGPAFNLPEFAGIFASMTGNAISGHFTVHQYPLTLNVLEYYLHNSKLDQNNSVHPEDREKYESWGEAIFPRCSRMTLQMFVN